MFKKLLLLLVMIASLQSAFAQMAEILGNVFYDNTNNRVTVRIAIRNNTNSMSNCEIAAMRIGYHFNETVLQYDGFNSYFFNGTDPSSGLNDATYVTNSGNDFLPERSTPYDDGTRSATIVTGGSKVLRKHYFNRSTANCIQLWSIPAQTYRVAFDIYFKFKPGYTPAMYNLNTPGYGFGSSNFIAQFFGSLNGSLTDAKKEIAVVIIRSGQSPYQPWDNSGNTCTGNVNPLPINQSSINFISPIDGLLKDDFERFEVKEKSDHLLLEWNVIENDRVDRFEIERRESDGSFVTRAMILSDNLKDTRYYSYKDKMTGSEGVLFYHLKTIELNGEVRYSSIIRLNVKERQSSSITILPNPGTSEISLQLPPVKGGFVCRIYNAEGKMVSVLNQTASPEMKVNISSFQRGDYFMEVYHPQTGKRYYGRFTKQ